MTSWDWLLPVFGLAIFATALFELIMSTPVNDDGSDQ